METKKINAWAKAIQHYEAGGTIRSCANMLQVTNATISHRLEVLSAAGVLKRKPRPSTFLQSLINKLK